MTANAAHGLPTEAAILEVVGLTHRFGSQVAVDNVTFSVSRGQVFGLLGPNGSGKSTVLSLISGVLPVQTGQIRYAGVLVSGHFRRFRSETAVVFQSPSLDKKLTAVQNLELTASMYGLGVRDASARIDHLLDVAGLSDRRHQRVGTYSGGLIRRLDIARALLPRPRLLLMDEPTSGLDEASFRSTWERLNAMCQGDNLTIVVATHRTEEADHCDLLAVFKAGVIIAIDSPQRLRNRLSKDIVVMATDEPRTLSEQIRSTFSLSTLTYQNSVLVECEDGHKWIPRLVETFPSGSFHSVSLRRPSLNDVFLKLTGTALGDGAIAHDSEEAARA
ncbi:MAG: ABC transporter ATP-binding protein [Myxococcales bacterium]|nr:ABC transporter ATP-binding protein [Myxococcales bacterium]